MRKIIPIIMTIIFTTSCTLVDKVEYSYIDKASMTLRLSFDKGDAQEIDNAIIYIFDGNNRFFRERHVDRTQIEEGVYETYLPNDRYTIISWVNCGDNTILPELSSENRLSEAVLKLAAGSDGYITADNLMYNQTNIDITKGDSKIINIDLDKVTYMVNITIDIKSLEDPTNYFFSLTHGTALNFENKSVIHPGIYTPILTLAENNMTGSFRVLNFDQHDPIQIGIYSMSGATLFETDIHRFIEDDIIPDLMSGKTVETNIKITIEETHIIIFIDDFYVTTIQRIDLGN